MADLIKIAEEAFATGKSFPEFKAGDTIYVRKAGDKLEFIKKEPKAAGKLVKAGGSGDGQE